MESDHWSGTDGLSVAKFESSNSCRKQKSQDKEGERENRMGGSKLEIILNESGKMLERSIVENNLN